MKTKPSKPRLPSELMAKSDERYWAAAYGDSFIRMHQRLWNCVYPVAALLLVVFWHLGRTSATWVFAVGVLMVYVLVLSVRGNFPRIKWTVDYRPPLLVLRSHTDLRTKEGNPVPPDDTGSGTGNHSYISQMCMQLWSWCRVTMLMQEISTDEHHAWGVILKTSEERWTEEMLRMADQSWVIVLFPSSTNGCITEMQLLSNRQDLLSKTVVFMPSSPSKLDRIVRHLFGFWGILQRDFASDWSAIAQELENHGFQLPAYRPEGMFYVPTPRFDAAKSALLDHQTSWERLVELVPHPGASKDHLWNIFNYGMAYEASDKDRILGWTDAKNGISPGSKVFHNEKGTFVYRNENAAEETSK